MFRLWGKMWESNHLIKDIVIDDVKSMLDNYDDLTIEDIDNIAKILKSLKD